MQTTGQRIWALLRGGSEPRYWLTRCTLLRAIAFVYLIAFLVAAHQAVPLVGTDGIFPVDQFLASVDDTWWSRPTIFWISQSDIFLLAVAWLGVGLSVIALLGRANALLMGLLWGLYLSFVNIGQLFYGYGWEMMLLEVGFLAIFLPPIVEHEPLPSAPPSPRILWLFRWLLFRVMFGAGLIKLRGDPCWQDLTCLMYHYETQPIPNPLSWYLHHLPDEFHEFGVLWNHFVELVVPWFLFGPRRLRHAAGALVALFQVSLIASGNLSFLNWLTLAVCIACFDDSALRWLYPSSWRTRAKRREAAEETFRWRRGVEWAVVGLVALLSVNPVINMISPDQVMNQSFSNYHVVNTYGAFGAVTKTRYEVVLEGTRERQIDADTKWKPYAFPCKPGPVRRRPCLISPYHYRLDWQMWFAAMSPVREHPWVLRFVYRLLEGHRGLTDLLARNPFPDEPPRFVRAVRYRYEFSDPGTEDRWWTREKVGVYLPPVSLETPWLREYLVETEFIEPAESEESP